MANFDIMDFKVFGKEGAPSLLLIPGLGVSYEIFLPLIGLLDARFRIVAVQVDGFTLGSFTRFTSIDDQAAQVIAYVKECRGGRLDCAYGLSLGGKILSRVLERNEVVIDHAVLDAAPLLPLPRWLEGPLRYYQCANVWTCYHWTGFWRWVFHSHYFDVHSGGGCSIRTISTSCWTNAGKCIPSGAAGPFWTAINRSIPIS